MTLRRPILAGYLLLLLLAGGFLGWAAFTPIAAAVLASGTLSPESGPRLIQHPEGGQIAQVLVREGALVTAGEVLLRLDGSALGAEIVRAEGRLAEAGAEAARLMAERDDRMQVTFPPDLSARAAAPLRLAQERLFAERHAAFRAAQDQTARRIDQIRLQIAGLDAALEATQRQRGLVAQDRARQADLVGRGLQTITRLEEIEREIARLDGQAGSQIAARAEAESRIAEAEQETAGRAAARREAAAADLRTILAERADLTERLLAAQARQAALELRAPVSGRVLGLRAAASVLQPGEPALILVPTGGPLVVEARIDPSDRDEVHSGQVAMLRIPALDPRGMADIEGRVVDVSADTLPDGSGGATHYTARIEVSGAASGPLADRLVPGMPVEVMIATRMRTVLSYLTGPLTGYFRKAFREG